LCKTVRGVKRKKICPRGVTKSCFVTKGVRKIPVFSLGVEKNPNFVRGGHRDFPPPPSAFFTGIALTKNTEVFIFGNMHSPYMLYVIHRIQWNSQNQLLVWEQYESEAGCKVDVMAISIKSGEGRGVIVLEKVGIPIVKINIFERFKYQKNRAVGIWYLKNENFSPPNF